MIAGAAILASRGLVSPMASPSRPVARVGILSIGNDTGFEKRLLIEELQKFGFEAGTNLVIEPRFSGVSLDQLGPFAQDLVNLKMDVILAISAQAAGRAQRLSTTVPIVAVMPLVTDPVGDGIVSSLGEPGGNLTGQVGEVPGMWAKRLEFLKHALPTSTRFAVLYGDISNLLEPARTLGVELHGFDVGPPDRGPFLGTTEVLRRIDAAVAWGADGVLASSTVNTTFDRTVIPLSALKNRLPTMSDRTDFTSFGGFMSYAADISEMIRRAVQQVGKVLNGASPRTLPMERPNKFILSANVATARELAVVIPDDIAAQVTEWVP